MRLKTPLLLLIFTVIVISACGTQTGSIQSDQSTTDTTFLSPAQKYNLGMTIKKETVNDFGHPKDVYAVHFFNTKNFAYELTLNKVVLLADKSEYFLINCEYHGSDWLMLTGMKIKINNDIYDYDDPNPYQHASVMVSERISTKISKTNILNMSKATNVEIQPQGQHHIDPIILSQKNKDRIRKFYNLAVLSNRTE